MPEEPRCSRAVLRGAFAAFLIALSAFRIAYANTHGLMYDEAYYWLWARHLAPGYYDQGPGVALAIRAGLLFGSSPGNVRTAAVVCAGVTSIAAYCLASRVFGNEIAGLWAGVCLNAVPLLFVGGILITHDSPQMATWAVALYCLARAVRIGEQSQLDPGEDLPRDRRASCRSTAWWLAAGVFVGMSMDCKYTAVLFLPCSLLFLCCEKRHRRWLRTPWPYTAMACAVVVFLPPVIWNLGHDWAAARHILNLGGANQRRVIDLGTFGDFLGGQLGVATLFLFTLGWAAVVAWRHGLGTRDSGLLLCGAFSWPVWAFFLLLSLHGQVEPNWPVPAYFSAVVCAPGLLLMRAQSTNPRRIIVPQSFALAVAAAGIVIFLFPGVILALPDGRYLAEKFAPKDRANEMYGWGQMAEALEHAGWSPGGRLAAAAVRYQDAAKLSFVLPGQPTTYDLPIERRHNQYDYWPPLSPGRDALVIVQDKEAGTVVPQLTRLFGMVRLIERKALYRQPIYQQPINIYQVLRCDDYRGGRTGLLTNQW